MPRLHPSPGFDKSALPAIALPLICLLIGLLGFLLNSSCAPPQIEIIEHYEQLGFLDGEGYLLAGEENELALANWLSQNYELRERGCIYGGIVVKNESLPTVRDYCTNEYLTLFR